MEATTTNHVPKWSNFFPAFSNAWTISGPVVSRWIQAFAWFSNWLGQNHPCLSDNSKPHDTMRRVGSTTRTAIQWEHEHKRNQEFCKHKFGWAIISYTLTLGLDDHASGLVGWICKNNSGTQKSHELATFDREGFRHDTAYRTIQEQGQKC
jgi:hypothetical protein